MSSVFCFLKSFKTLLMSVFCLSSPLYDQNQSSLLFAVCLSGIQNTQAWVICLYFCFKYHSQHPMFPLPSSRKVHKTWSHRHDHNQSSLFFAICQKAFEMRSHVWSAPVSHSNILEYIQCALFFSYLSKTIKSRRLFKTILQKDSCSLLAAFLSLKHNTNLPCLLSACASKPLAMISKSPLSAQNRWQTAAWLLLFSLPKTDTHWHMEFIWSAEKYSNNYTKLLMFPSLLISLY